MKWYCILLVVVACREPGDRAAPSPTPPRRDAGPGDPADAMPQRFVGVLSAANSADIAPRAAGVIAKVHVGAGDQVQAGQVVAEMDPAELRAELRAAEAALSSAQAASRHASVELEDAKRKLALETRAVQQGVSPTSALDAAKLDVKRAEAAVSRARSAAQAESIRVQAAKEQIADTGLRAPFSGTVTKRYRDAGNRVQAGTAIVNIVGNSNIRLRYAVPPELARSVVVGATVTATVDTVTAPVTATIKHVAPTIDPASGLIFVDAELPTAGTIGELRPGLAAWVTP